MSLVSLSLCGSRRWDGKRYSIGDVHGVYMVED
jgi:hypothetical protein